MRTVSFLGSFGLAIGEDKYRKSCPKNGPLSPANCVFAQKYVPLQPPVSGQQIVSAASSDSAPNEIANRRRFG